MKAPANALIQDRPLSRVELTKQADDFARQLQKASFDEVLTALDAGELSRTREELLSRSNDDRNDDRSATLAFMRGNDFAPIPIATANHGKLELYLMQNLVAAKTEGRTNGESYRLETRAYFYRLHTAGGDAVIRWEY